MTPPAGKPRRPRTSKPKSKPKSPPEPVGLPSSSDSSASPLGLAGDPFVRPKDAPAAKGAAELDRPEYVPPAPPPVEWTPERMEVVLRGFGYVLHAVDPVAGGPLSPDLWKLTEEDAKAIAGPATRIANRYAVVRGAAGFSDEIGVVTTLAPYVKRNLAERGRVKAAHEIDERESPGLAVYQPETVSPPETPAPERTSELGSPQERQPGRQPGDLPEIRLAPPAGSPAGSEDELLQASKSGVGDAFEHTLPAGDVSLPPFETERG